MWGALLSLCLFIDDHPISFRIRHETRRSNRHEINQKASRPSTNISFEMTRQSKTYQVMRRQTEQHLIKHYLCEMRDRRNPAYKVSWPCGAPTIAEVKNTTSSVAVYLGCWRCRRAWWMDHFLSIRRPWSTLGDNVL